MNLNVKPIQDAKRTPHRTRIFALFDLDAANIDPDDVGGRWHYATWKMGKWCAVPSGGPCNMPFDAKPIAFVELDELNALGDLHIHCINKIPIIEHIDGGDCEIRMNAAERQACERQCAKAGNPPCYVLPALTSDWPKGDPVEPCDFCREGN